jgi:hypothetical protein
MESRVVAFYDRGDVVGMLADLPSDDINGNKTLHRALTRWAYTNKHITIYDTYMQ